MPITLQLPITIRLTSQAKNQLLVEVGLRKWTPTFR